MVKRLRLRPFTAATRVRVPSGSPFSKLKSEVKLFMYEFRYVKGHIEVYLDGKFQFSADTMKEAREELENE